MTNDLIGGDWDDIRPHIEDDLRIGAFEMDTKTVQAWKVRYYFPRGETPAVDWECVVNAANERAAKEVARVSWMLKTRESKAFMTAIPIDGAISDQDIEYVWGELQATPSYCERYQLAATVAPFPS